MAASRIARLAVVEPVTAVEGVELTAVAARDLARARETAERWGAPLSFGSYAEMIESDEIDAVYIGTPAAHHRQWAIAAIEAGKHVLCEKPFAANADDARLIADAARIREVLDSGVLGRIDRIDASFDIPDGRIARTDIRWDLPLGGGSTMDLGCYSLQWARFAAGSDPEIVSAEAVCPVDGVDGSLGAELRWPSGVTGRIHSSMIAPGATVEAWLRVTGEFGTLTATNPLAPQHGNATLVVDLGERVWFEPADTSATYYHQLVAFRDAILYGTVFPTTADDGVRTMELIDACYRAAGLRPRPSFDGPNRAA